MARYRVGIDVGGTFTDLVMTGDDGSLHRRKLLTTPDDYGRAIAEGLRGAIDAAGVAPAAIERIVHATTVATNAILERKGAATGLVTTRGFRDVLEMRRLRIPEMYTLNYRKPDPLVPRRLRLEVDERMGPRGDIKVPLDEASVRAAAARLDEEKVDSVAVTLLHAYANPRHEQRVAEVLRHALPGAFITCSSDILPEIREYERTSTTVINAYLGPALRRYFESLKRHLAAIGVAAPIDVMKSDGGVMSLRAAGEAPAYLVESGPAAGVIGAARSGAGDCLTLDMGGTTAKAAMVEGGRVARTGDYEVGAGINLSSKLVMGGGYALKLPVIDISEIGAGGGSIVTIDRGGMLRVGPESAGAAPGPVAYDRGGLEPTFTDACVALGYLNPRALVGGALPLDAEKACRVLAERVAKPIDRALLDAAYGIYEIACGTMVRAVKAVSTYRGRDPRDFALFAFGGNGPVVACAIAELLEMSRVIVPPHPGVFSAHGLLLSDIEQERAKALLRRLAEIEPRRMLGMYHEIEAALIADFAEESYRADAIAVERFADLRYAGQAHELTIDWIAARDGAPDLVAMAEAFGREHERTYGHRAEAEAVECVTLRAKGRVKSNGKLRAGVARPESGTAAQRHVYFGRAHGQIETPVVSRAATHERRGPMIVEEYDSTCVVPPGWRAALDDGANLFVTKQ